MRINYLKYREGGILTKIMYWLTAILTSLLILTAVAPDRGWAEKINLTILHTSDIHSHLSEFTRLATQIEKIKKSKAEKNEPVLLLDSGDFIVGTLYHSLSDTLSPELTLMSLLGYDATTLGNHELEWGPETLATIIDLARKNGSGSITPIVASNIEFNSFDSGDDSLKKLYDEGILKNYIVKKLPNGLKIGIIGLLGKSAEEEAPQPLPLRFKHSKEFIQHLVKLVRRKGVDLLILLSHSGLKEDKKLAQSTQGIDIIISGHCHSTLSQPIIVEDTLIVEAGPYAKYLGKLEISLQEEKTYLRSYQLIPIDDNIPENENIQKIISSYIHTINKEVLNPIGLTFDNPLAETNFDLIGERGYLIESNLGDLITDANRFAIDSYQPQKPVDFVFQPRGFIRGNIKKGIIKTSDVFEVLSFGIGPNKKKLGYPLVSFYLNAQEIRRILEISTYLASKRGSHYLFQVSGMRYWYDPLQLMFWKVARIDKGDSIAGYIPLNNSDTKTLYKVGTNLFLLELLFIVRQYVPWLAIIPKDDKGNVILFSTTDGREKILVDKDPVEKGVQELKEWQAFINYLSQFPDLDKDSLPDIPERYAKPQTRINQISKN